MVDSVSSLRQRLIRLLETLFSGGALICFRVSIVPPIAAVVTRSYRDGDAEPIALRRGFERWARVQRPPPSARLT